MKRLFGTLRARLLVSHLAVVAVGVLVLVVAGRSLGPVFVDDHLTSMGHMMQGMAAGEAAQLEEGITSAFNQALLWAAIIGAVAAMAAASFAAVRLLRPLEDVRRVARRLAGGSYHERVPLPQEEELAAVASDVNALAQALEETEQRRLRLVSEVAHELRTPVATLKGYMEGLLDGVFEPDPETLGAAVREARRMERLADDLSELSRTEEAGVELRLAPVDLARLAGEVAERLRPQFDDQEVNLTVDAGPELEVVVDRDRMSQVLTNLIGNALSYTPPGGRVEIRPRLEAGVARIEVSDTGRGLTADQAAMVFERFYRADRSVTGGTGIGLTIARSLARLHGGDVAAFSPGPSRGSTFVLTVPTGARQSAS
ncbi:MAG TPA: ATP-binding protein [Acidimicrobiia bacterium]